MRMSIIGPVPALMMTICSLFFIRALLMRRNQGDYLCVYALGIAPIAAYASSFVFFERNTEYLDAFGLVLTTVLTVLTTALLLGLAHVIVGYVPPTFGNRINQVRARPFVSIFCLAIVALIIYFASHFPVLSPCTTSRCTAAGLAWGDKTQVQNVVILFSFITNFLACGFFIGARVVIIKIWKDA